MSPSRATIVLPCMPFAVRNILRPSLINPVLPERDGDGTSRTGVRDATNVPLTPARGADPPDRRRDRAPRAAAGERRAGILSGADGAAGAGDRVGDGAALRADP